MASGGPLYLRPRACVLIGYPRGVLPVGLSCNRLDGLDLKTVVSVHRDVRIGQCLVVHEPCSDGRNACSRAPADMPRAAPGREQFHAVSSSVLRPLMLFGELPYLAGTDPPY